MSVSNLPQVSPQHNERNEVRKSNQLIEARYRLTLGEQRLILHLCSLIHSSDEDFKSYDIRVKDFAKMFGLEKRNNIYKAVENAAKELAGKRLTAATQSAGRTTHPRPRAARCWHRVRT